MWEEWTFQGNEAAGKHGLWQGRLPCGQCGHSALSRPPSSRQESHTLGRRGRFSRRGAPSGPSPQMSCMPQDPSPLWPTAGLPREKRVDLGPSRGRRSTRQIGRCTSAGCPKESLRRWATMGSHLPRTGSSGSRPPPCFLMDLPCFEWILCLLTRVSSAILEATRADGARDARPIIAEEYSGYTKEPEAYSGGGALGGLLPSVGAWMGFAMAKATRLCWACKQGWSLECLSEGRTMGEA